MVGESELRVWRKNEAGLGTPHARVQDLIEHLGVLEADPYLPIESDKERNGDDREKR